ncbi:hypothetical protein J3Q64DRAFT_1701286 [Phycomyces blakesleeanus]|uniref:BTB domain-containing protein n=2 Tax=Phycomyces blakesleeanus TaxID=4837 RepID=A0A162YL81_PHYB8|nr:hypothetical protein PHYBLDRAFT_162075 [Phycomyces blakesleeanus NRRL 1555(-)]OAD81465.1 hypothetical protein PHYBLDRAFT_162075 [Phycomyces blakesleeanus NRRL 1555(-)]|eukprot:XP_018299505.1 hypothetical protein PHYBLDRAFT_162075 [Phycomyces blakesleeanus NRRL 1555(-)]
MNAELVDISHYQLDLRLPRFGYRAPSVSTAVKHNVFNGYRCQGHTMRITLQKMKMRNEDRMVPDHIKATCIFRINQEEEKMSNVSEKGNSDGNVYYLWRFSSKAPISFHLEPVIRILVGFEDTTGLPLRPTSLIALPTYVNSSEFFDVTVNKNLNVEILNATVILSAASPWFKTLFTSGMGDSNSKRVIIRGIHPRIFSKILSYIYSSSYKVQDVDEALETIKAADRIELRSLCNTMFDYLKLNINITNVWSIWELTVDYDSKDTDFLCQEFIRKNLSTLVKNKEWLDLGPGTTIRVLRLRRVLSHALEEDLYNHIVLWRENAKNKVAPKSPNATNPNTANVLATTSQSNLSGIQTPLLTLECIEDFFAEMLELICFDQMSMDFLLNTVETNPAVMHINSCRELIQRAVYLKVP